MQYFKTILSDITNIFYPHLCNGCGTDIVAEDSLLCARCILDLPHTTFAQHANNPIEKIFWGRIPLAGACSEFYFTKESLIQHLVHQLKYKSNQAIGVYLGQLMGLYQAGEGAGFIGSIVGALVLLFAYVLIKRKSS